MPLHDTKTGRILPDPRTTEERFWSKVDVRGPDDCWPWLTGLNTSGYGQFWISDTSHPASRMAYIFTFGPIADSIYVCHSCDDRYPVGDRSYKRCCNPAHLFLGTTAENTRDASRKGLLLNGPRKLTESQVRVVLEHGPWARGDIARLSTELGVTHRTITMIRNRDTWKQVV